MMPDIIHALEQAEAMLRDLAPVLATYHRSLMAQGFTREEALEIVVGWQASLLGAGKSG